MVVYHGVAKQKHTQNHRFTSFLLGAGNCPRHTKEKAPSSGLFLFVLFQVLPPKSAADFGNVAVFQSSEFNHAFVHLYRNTNPDVNVIFHFSFLLEKDVPKIATLVNLVPIKT